jgi:nucleoside-triphosphatase THEP1
MTTIVEKYGNSTLGESFAISLDDFLGQSVNPEASIYINAKVLPQGRYKERAPRTTKPKAIKVSDEAISAVSALVSDEDIFTRPNGDKYHARKWGEHTDIEVLRKAREAKQYVLLYGNPGCGKTALVEGAFGDDLYTIIGTGDTEVGDFLGGYVQTPSGGFEWVDGVLTRAVEEGKVLLIDEVGLIDPKVMSVVYGLIDGRKELVITQNPERGIVKAKEGFYLMGATNPNAPGVRLSEALLSRCLLQAEMTTDYGLAQKLGVPRLAITASQNLYKKQQEGQITWSPQMRELEAFRETANIFGTKFAVENLLASSPENDRAIVAETFARVFGEEFRPAKI